MWMQLKNRADDPFLLMGSVVAIQGPAVLFSASCIQADEFCSCRKIAAIKIAKTKSKQDRDQNDLQLY